MQNDLFDTLSNDPLHADNLPIADVELEAIGVIQQLVRNRFVTSERFIDRLNLTLRGTGKKKVTQSQWNKWMAPSQPHQLPFWLIPNICLALGHSKPAELLVAPLGRTLADSSDNILKDMAAADMAKVAADRERKRLQKMIDEMVQQNG